MVDENEKIIEGFLNYTVTSDGTVKNRTTGNALKHTLMKDGYYKVTLYNDGKGTIYKVHRLIALAYIPNPDGFPSVDHINRNKEDNCVQNLRWCTEAGNLKNLSKRKNPTSSKYMGVSWCNTKKRWRASVQINGKRKSIGYYQSELDAAENFNRVAHEHGYFHLNEIRDASETSLILPTLT
jgi:hypothetical protein